MHTEVITRSVDLAPRRTFAADQQGETIILTNKDGSGPIGFPLDAVYEFDAAVWAQLDAAWRQHDVVRLKALWRNARRFVGVSSDQ